jgi:hypothetical protein
MQSRIFFAQQIRAEAVNVAYAGAAMKHVCAPRIVASPFGRERGG